MSPASQTRVQCLFAALLAVNLGLALLLSIAAARAPAAARMPVEAVRQPDFPPSGPAAVPRHIAAAWTHGAHEEDAAE